MLVALSYGGVSLSCLHTGTPFFILIAPSFLQVAMTVLGHRGWAGQIYKHVSDSLAITFASRKNCAISGLSHEGKTFLFSGQ